VDFYENAHRNEQAAIGLFGLGHYQQCISLACLAVELYLKSKLHLVPHKPHLEYSHDVIEMYELITKRFKPKTNLRAEINRSRKYFNESRYPYDNDLSVYTADFAQEFLDLVAKIRTYIDEDCLATLDDLRNKYQGGNPCEP